MVRFGPDIERNISIDSEVVPDYTAAQIVPGTLKKQ